jgi:hypothetical protein
MLFCSNRCVFGNGIDAEVVVDEQIGVVLISSDEENLRHARAWVLGATSRGLSGLRSLLDRFCVLPALVAFLTDAFGEDVPREYSTACVGLSPVYRLS